MSSLENWSPIAKEYHPLSCGSIDGTDDYPHDKGIIRALSSKYDINKQVEGDPLCTIFVGRLNPETTEDTLRQIFADYGNIKRLRLVRDIISGFSKRYAFIEYKSGSSARKAASRADKTTIDEREILVDMECERELKGWIPRRLGGGFGGKKESGQLRFGGKDRPFRKPIVFNRISHADDRQSKGQVRLNDIGQSSISSHKTEQRHRDHLPEYHKKEIHERNRTRDVYDTNETQRSRSDRECRHSRDHKSDRDSTYHRHSRQKSPSPNRSSQHRHKSRKHKSRSRSTSREQHKRKKSRRD